MARCILLLISGLWLSIASGQDLSGADYCWGLLTVESICEVQTSSFYELPASEKAICFCGSTLDVGTETFAWGPSFYDDLAQGCYSYAVTAIPDLATSASRLQTFCAQYATTTHTLVGNSLESNTLLTPAPSAYIEYGNRNQPNRYSHYAEHNTFCSLDQYISSNSVASFRSIQLQLLLGKISWIWN
ncbi:hypothetical protein LTR84_001640 [Exophiala bonariae]|uniref:Uncharacterized protein n=1 Tax=Exophiala bonariae TaxID=1690606 RepID=A0AAV9NDB1_9EURO|nr:hypothetical protein LTR84_001640 [Exophiala bonariae]